MKTGSERGSLKRKRNKLKALPFPPARVQFLSPAPQGEVTAAPDVCLFPLCLVRMVQQGCRGLGGARTTEQLYPEDEGKQKCGIQECAQPWALGQGQG